MCVCVCVQSLVRVYTHIHTRTHTLCVCTHTHTRTHTHIHTHTMMGRASHTHIHARTHTHTHTHHDGGSLALEQVIESRVLLRFRAFFFEKKILQSQAPVHLLYKVTTESTFAHVCQNKKFCVTLVALFNLFFDNIIV